MVKLINPVHSDAASGTLARTTFGRGRGINYAHLTVKPPQTPINSLCTSLFASSPKPSSE